MATKFFTFTPFLIRLLHIFSGSQFATINERVVGEGKGGWATITLINLIKSLEAWGCQYNTDTKPYMQLNNIYL